MSLRNLVGRGFGGTVSSPGPTPPLGAGLTVVDQQDGTGATATITGAAGYTNKVFVYSTAMDLVGSFTRSGNGTLDLVLEPGIYLAILASDDFYAASPVYFQVTSGPTTVVDHAELLAVLLSSTSRWQSLTGTINAGQARAFIQIYEHLETANYPRALVQDDPLWGSAVGFGQSHGGGTLCLSLWFQPDASVYTTREARRSWVRAQVLQLKKEMETISNSRATPAGYTVSHLVVKKITLICPPLEIPASRTPVHASQDAKQVWGAEFQVEW